MRPPPTVRKVTLDSVLTLDKFQIRAELDLEALEDYKAAYESGSTFPPVVVFESPDGQTRWLVDGFHRVGAQRRLNRLEVDAEVHVGTEDEAFQWALENANVTNGMRYTNADKKRKVELFLQRGSTLTDSEVAAKCLVTQPFVSRLRGEIGLKTDTRTQEEKRDAVLKCLVEDPKMSARKVAAVCGVDKKTVLKLKEGCANITVITAHPEEPNPTGPNESVIIGPPTDPTDPTGPNITVIIGPPTNPTGPTGPNESVIIGPPTNPTDPTDPTGPNITVIIGPPTDPTDPTGPKPSPVSTVAPRESQGTTSTPHLQEMADLKEVIAHRDTEIATLTSQVADLSATVSSLEDALADVSADNAALRAELGTPHPRTFLEAAKAIIPLVNQEGSAWTPEERQALTEVMRAFKKPWASFGK